MNRHDVSELNARIAGRKVVASVSGGKDSAAMSIYLHELGIEHERVFMDTGWEHDDTYAYLRDVLPGHIGPITWLRPKLQMRELILKKGMFPSRLRRYCTEELKIKPMAKYLGELQDAGDDVINAVGVRRAESVARSGLEEWEWSDAHDCEIWRPLVTWSEQDVIDAHARHSLPPNPMYMMGASRVGCWPCIMARKDEIRRIADTDPGRIDLIRSLEQSIEPHARERMAVRGEELKNPPAWFQAPIGGTGECWPIDKVVEWSRTARGGRQFDLFHPDEEPGCVRWGLCEASPKKGAA